MCLITHLSQNSERVQHYIYKIVIFSVEWIVGCIYSFFKKHHFRFLWQQICYSYWAPVPTELGPASAQQLRQWILLRPSVLHELICFKNFMGYTVHCWLSPGMEYFQLSWNVWFGRKSVWKLKNMCVISYSHW